MTVPQPIGVPFKGVSLTWEQDGPVPIIRVDSVLTALGMTRQEFDTATLVCENTYWGDDYFEYDCLYDAMLEIAGSRNLRVHMFGF